jgi:hypothetical protein
MKKTLLALIAAGALAGSISSREIQSSVEKDSIVAAGARQADVDTFIATYENPFKSVDQDSALDLTNSSDNNQGRIHIISADSGLGVSTCLPNVLYMGEVISYHGENGGENGEKSIFPEKCQGDLSGVKFIEARPSEASASEYPDPERLLHDKSSAEIPLAERFVTRSLDRNTAVVFLYIDGGGPAQYDWTSAMKDTTYNKSIQMLQQVVDNAHKYGIDITITAIWAFVEIPSEPVLCPAGLYYGSADLWGENDLDVWRSEAIGAFGYSPNLRGFFNMIKDASSASHCQQVATIFVINSDTLTHHTNGSPLNWAADWNFDYRFSKPYCTVERRGGAISDVAFKGVANHELFHLFGAADEYDGSSDCADQADCGNGKYGMLLAANDNCPLCVDGEQDPCVMNDPINQPSDVCWHTRLALGWYDPDNNGGGLVDDIPVDYTALVTGDFQLGDCFQVATLGGAFVNAFRVSDYNSYLQADGSRTVQVLGCDYAREKINPDIYYGKINDGDPFTFTLNLNNSHPAAAITNYSGYGPYFKFTFDGVAHVNMKVKNIYTGEWWYSYTGRLLAGSSTDYKFLWKNWEWVKDGSYPNNNLGWVCDGVNTPLSSNNHSISYGPPGKWNMLTLEYIQDSDIVHAEWDPASWTSDAYLYENATAIVSLASPFGWYNGVSYYNVIGSDSCNVFVRALNPNGVSYSDSMYYITLPNPPRDVQFTEEWGTVGLWNNMQYVNNSKIPFQGDPKGYKLNQIGISCIQPDLQRTENISGYLIRTGHYFENYPGNYIWKKDSLYIPMGAGWLRSKLIDLDPNCEYFVNIATVDKFGGKSENALSPWDSVTVGVPPVPIPNVTTPANDASKKSDVGYEFSALQNYPNPFNPKTMICFLLPAPMRWKLSVYNIVGEAIKEFNGDGNLGLNEVEVDLSEEATGVYFYRLESGGFSEVRKMMMLK